MQNASGFLLAQVAPAATAAVQAYQNAELTTEVTRIVICNTTASPASYSIYHDDAGGGSYAAGTALYFGVVLPANTSETIEITGPNGGFHIKKGGEFAVQTSVADALTFSLYGMTQRISHV